MIRKLLFFVLLVVISFSVIACRSDKSDGKQVEKEVIMKNYEFNPSTLEINKGETVKWINKDSMAHSLTSNLFKSGNIPKGQTYKFTFNEVGEFEYTDVYFPDKKAKIIVR